MLYFTAKLSSTLKAELLEHCTVILEVKGLGLSKINFFGRLFLKLHTSMVSQISQIMSFSHPSFTGLSLIFEVGRYIEKKTADSNLLLMWCQHAVVLTKGPAEGKILSSHP